MARSKKIGVAATAALGAALIATPASAVTMPEHLAIPENQGTGAASTTNYDIERYRIALGYDRAADAVDGTTKITAKALSPTRAFTFDFAKTPGAATVDGEPVKVENADGKTTITLAKTLAEGDTVTIVISYEMTPEGIAPTADLPAVKAPDGDVDAGESGIPATWFPHSVKPDAASFDFVNAVPAYLKAHRTAEGARYLDAKAATEKAAERRPQWGEHRAEVEARRAAVKQAYAERWAEWKKAAEQRRAEWKQARAERRAAMKEAAAERRAEWKAAHRRAAADHRAEWRDRSDGEQRARAWHRDGERGDRGDRGEFRGHRDHGHHGHR